ncbi:putative sodium-coupled neutral amino acid transporter 7 [Mizuhopecten yessoensis]|uniref:Sodium-coupled neutral amino acid transporter 7 n=1 Tax=Mizuhopecten yessoensis TaxID=6573 RepID=A0A210R5T3_MIZYE|nr:putative sodium-coupled neutral amino acid transporter 7 [Mizuhopecten yessoensis]OWF56382.1 sodium-coupled neutral amino acid transporter 7 [Mizuhopecten yessoensis]
MIKSVQNPDYIRSDEYEGEDVGLLSEQQITHYKTAGTANGSTWYASVFLVVNAALGAGLLNFPDAYHKAGGVMVAVIIQAVFLVFIVVALMILAYCSDLNKTTNYQDVVLSVCGKNAQRFCAFTIMVYCFGTCITFLIIIGDQWEEVFLFTMKDTYCHQSPWYMNRISTICISSLFLILPLCFPRRIDFLKYPSALGVVGILYVVVLVTYKYATPHTTPHHITTQPKQWMDLFLVVPTICFAYQCHVSVIPIYSCMNKRGMGEFGKTIGCAMALCVLTYTVVAAFGYLTFGDAITSDILLSYDPAPEVLVAVILIAVKTYTTYPILLFCGRAALDCLWVDVRRMSPERVEETERPRRILVTIIWFVATLAMAIFIPNIGVVIQILGAFAAIFIFVFPGMCMINAVQMKANGVWDRKLEAMMIFACSFVVLGTFIFGLTLTQSILSDSGGVKADKSKYTC